MSFFEIIKSSICRETPRIENSIFKQAAVLIGIVEAPSGDRVIFNLRAQCVKNNPGEICLPGGMLESIDAGSHINAAMREAHEEIGLPVENIQVIGRLDSCFTSQKIEVAPIVALITRPNNWILQPTEVEEIIELPLDCFLKKENYRTVSRRYYGGTVKSISIICDRYEVWGITAKVMMRLQQIIG